MRSTPKPKKSVTKLTATRPVETLIRLIRGQKVMIDSDLATLYGVTTGALNQAIKRNRERFPPDFMFQVSEEESEILKSQIVISTWGGRRRSLPHAFTQEGVAMLSSVLRSARAIQMNIHIMRAFVRMREFIASNGQLATRVERLERGQQRTASVIGVLAEDIDRLGEEVKEMKVLPAPKKRQWGFPAKALHARSFE